MEFSKLEDLAGDAGLHAIGVCSADPFVEVATSLDERKAAGLNGKLGFTYAEPELSTDIRRTYPWAERLVVGIRSYVPEAGTPQHQKDLAVVARFAVDDAYQPLMAALEVLAEALRDEGWRAAVIADDNRLVDRAAAVRAGVGWWGKNTMMLAPKVGPWVLIGTVVTDAPLEITQPMKRDCGTCDACIPACPTGALVAPGVLDARRCLAAWAQAPGVIPVEYREAMGDRLYGCDDCLDACPPGIRLLESATEVRGMVDIRWLLGTSDQALLDRFDRWYIPKRDPKYVRRNALIVAGNSRDIALVDDIIPFLGDRSSIVRQHAAWALGRIGGADSVAALGRARHDETVLGVKQELDLALVDAR